MPTPNHSIHRATVSLKMPAKVADFIAYGTGIVHAMTGNPAFPAPVPALSALSAALSRASYEWEYSTDGGKTWVGAPSTLQAKTTVIGLPVGTSVLFRYKTVTKAGEGDWSQGLALLVK